jgi:hypothetical protein
MEMGVDMSSAALERSPFYRYSAVKTNDPQSLHMRTAAVVVWWLIR